MKICDFPLLEGSSEFAEGTRASAEGLVRHVTADAASTTRPARYPIGLSFWVSQDEEDVRVHVRQGRRVIDLGERASHFLFLTLARKRLADVSAGISDGESGWYYVDELSRDPSMVPLRLNVDVCRIRKRLASSGLVGANQIIERRICSRQLRIGTGDLWIGKL